MTGINDSDFDAVSGKVWLNFSLNQSGAPPPPCLGQGEVL